MENNDYKVVATVSYKAAWLIGFTILLLVLVGVALLTQ